MAAVHESERKAPAFTEALDVVDHALADPAPLHGLGDGLLARGVVAAALVGPAEVDEPVQVAVLHQGGQAAVMGVEGVLAHLGAGQHLGHGDALQGLLARRPLPPGLPAGRLWSAPHVCLP